MRCAGPVTLTQRALTVQSQIVTSVDRVLRFQSLSTHSVFHSTRHRFTQLSSIHIDCQANITKLVERSQQEAFDTILAGWLDGRVV